MAEVEGSRVYRLDLRQRFVCLARGGVGGLGRDLRAGPSGRDVHVVDGISDEQRIFGWGVEDAVALGMPGGVDRVQSSRHVELVAVVERDDLRDLRLLGGSVGDHVAQRAATVGVLEHAEHGQRRALGLLGLALPGAVAVGAVDVHRDPVRPLQRAGESDVVGVGVGQDNRPDVIDRAAHFRQGGLQRAAVAAQPSVDQRDLAVLLEQEEVHEFRSHRVDHRRGPLAVVGGMRGARMMCSW